MTNEEKVAEIAELWEWMRNYVGDLKESYKKILARKDSEEWKKYCEEHGMNVDEWDEYVSSMIDDCLCHAEDMRFKISNFEVYERFDFSNFV